MTEIGLVCSEYNVYLHCDAAYAGNGLICEELRQYMHGLEYVNSLSYNTNKWMLVNFDSSCLWVKDKYSLNKALSVDPVYLQYKQMEKAIDYRNWSISLSRRFKSLKLWFTIRSYGVEGLRKYMRNHVKLAKYFESMVKNDSRFEIIGKVTMGLVCFRLKGHNILTKTLLFTLNESRDIHLTPAIINDKYMIRFCVNSKEASMDDMNNAWNLIEKTAETVIINNKIIKNPLLNSKFASKKLLTDAQSRRQCLIRMLSVPMKYKPIAELPLHEVNEDKHGKEEQEEEEENIKKTTITKKYYLFSNQVRSSSINVECYREIKSELTLN
jgi:tyrosine decarboxylase